MKMKSESEVAQSCPTPSDPMDCSLLGSSVHGIFQARVLEWGAMAFSRDPMQGFIYLYLGCNFFLFKNFLYLSLAVLGLHCGTQVFLGCGERGLLSSCGVQLSQCSGFTCCEHRSRILRLSSFGSRAPEQRLSSCGARA